MTEEPQWDPTASSNVDPPKNEYGVISRLITEYGPHGGKEPYPEEESGE